MGRFHRIAFGGALSAVALGGLVVSWHVTQSTASAPQAAAPAPSVIVSSPLTREIVEWSEFAGRFEPSASVEVRARVTGHLRSVNFEDGEIVEAGRLLFVVDQRPYQTALAEARARLASAEAQVELADIELGRAQQLGSNTVSQASIDQRRQAKKAADAARDLARAAAERAQIDLDFTEIRAPISGRVSNRRVDGGSLVSDSVLLTTIVALDPIYFVFDISERDLVAYQRGVSTGDLPPVRDKNIKVQARLQDDGGWPYEGTIDFVDNRLEPGSGTIRARARLPNQDLFITPGQFGHLRLPLSGSHQALLLPETAMLTDQADRFVLAVNPDNTLRAAKVVLGSQQPDGLRVVRSGLQPDDRIVINGLMRARAGQTVSPQAGDIGPRSTASAN